MKRAVIAALVLAGCASTSNPGLRASDPPHPALAGEVDWADGSFAGAGGVPLYFQRWRPRGAIRGVLVVHHGLADHSDRYQPFARALVDAGYAVWAFDMRGHGRSGGPRVRFDGLDPNLDDLDTFVARVRAAEPGAPLFVWGHSVGGLIVTLDAIERHPQVDGVIVAAPAIGFEAPLLQIGGLVIASTLAPGFAALETPHGEFSNDRAVNAAMDRDPLIAQGKGPARSARAIIDGVARVWARPEAITVPILALHGTGDHLTAPAGSRDLIAAVASADRTLRIYPGFAHDLVHEPGGGADQVTADVRAWLDAHTGGPAWTAPAPPTGPLPGDGGARMIALELDVRVDGPRADLGGGDHAVTGGLHTRVGLGRATPLQLGWFGGLTARAGEGGYEADLYPIGVAGRSCAGGWLAIAAGIGAGGPRGNTATHLPVELSGETPLGPVRLFARAAAGWRLSGDRYADDAGLADELSAQVGVRLGRDRHYYRPVVAGGGPFLAIGYRNQGGAESIGVSLGLALFGGR